MQQLIGVDFHNTYDNQIQKVATSRGVYSLEAN